MTSVSPFLALGLMIVLSSGLTAYGVSQMDTDLTLGAIIGGSGLAWAIINIFGLGALTRHRPWVFWYLLILALTTVAVFFVRTWWQSPVIMGGGAFVVLFCIYSAWQYQRSNHPSQYPFDNQDGIG